MTEKELYEEYQKRVIRTRDGRPAVSFYTWLRSVGVMY